MSPEPTPETDDHPRPGTAPDRRASDDSGDPDALALVVLLTRSQSAVAGRIDRALSAHHGLSFGDFVLLRELGAAPGGSMRRVDLAEAVGLSPSGVTRAVAPLERIGLVSRQANPRDARVALTTLTGTGQEVLADATVTAARAAGAVHDAARWTADDARTLHRLLAGVVPTT